MIISPVTLIGTTVRLEPLGEHHVPDLAIAGRDEVIWRWMPYGLVTDEPRMAKFVRQALERQMLGTDLPFAVVHLATGRAVGSTRYLDIRPEHLGLEIGATWYATAHQRTRINTECKYLLLQHSFEELGCMRVQLKTDLRNERSQRAIERIGGQREGVLRNQLLMPDGHRRATVLYSIIDTEWPAIKARLAEMLEPTF
jgi:RimJ/RimL family protein N-acetyltransferase